MNTNFLFAFLDVGAPELMLIVFIALLLFGGKKLPELAKGVGKAVKEFKAATSGVEDEIKRAMNENREEKQTSAAADPVLMKKEPAPIMSSATSETADGPAP